MFTMPPSTFTLNDKEMDNIRKWLEEHTKNCPCFEPKTAGWFGSPIHYVFTPSSIGTGVRIKCNCGAEADVGDYENL